MWFLKKKSENPEIHFNSPRFTVVTSKLKTATADIGFEIHLARLPQPPPSPHETRRSLPQTRHGRHLSHLTAMRRIRRSPARGTMRRRSAIWQHCGRQWPRNCHQRIETRGLPASVDWVDSGRNDAVSSRTG